MSGRVHGIYYNDARSDGSDQEQKGTARTSENHDDLDGSLNHEGGHDFEYQPRHTRDAAINVGDVDAMEA